MRQLARELLFLPFRQLTSSASTPTDHFASTSYQLISVYYALSRLVKRSQVRLAHSHFIQLFNFTSAPLLSLSGLSDLPYVYPVSYVQCIAPRSSLTLYRSSSCQNLVTPANSIIPEVPSNSTSCVVCGKESMLRCSACANNGLDWMSFCSTEHQKLVSPLSALRTEPYR